MLWQEDVRRKLCDKKRQQVPNNQPQVQRSTKFAHAVRSSMSQRIRIAQTILVVVSLHIARNEGSG